MKAGLKRCKRNCSSSNYKRNKRDERSIVVKNKARLITQGFRQEEGIDYDEAFAPIARIEVIGLFLAFASFMGFHVYQIDVKSAFLYGTIREEVYVHQPPGFVDPAHPYKVYKVIKALYGLHQAPRACQDKYVADILKKFDFCSIKTATTPIELNKPMVKDKDGVDVDMHVYRSMIGSLMYLTASRPDIMFVVCACANFQVTPKASHLNAVKRIFRYLKHQPKLGLWYPRDSPFELEAFSDSDYGGDSLDRKSTIGGCQFLGRRLISWQCKKHTIVANSTTEAEYVAAANCYGQVLWIQNQMMDYGFNFMNTKIHIDNKNTICIVKNPLYHSRTKHIEIRHHFIRDCYEKRLIDVIKIHTDANVADLLTKGFDVTRFNFLVVSIGMLNLTSMNLRMYGSCAGSLSHIWSKLCTEFEKLMHKKFQMSSMGELTFFLGLQVTQKDNEIFISQDKYIDEILKKFDFSTVKTTTPMETSKPLMKDENTEDVHVHLYRSMIGSLMYLTSLRPDIMFVVCTCERFQVTPKVSHLHAVKRIFIYLKGQPKLGLWYPKDSPFDLEDYTDSDYAGASLDRKSTTRGCQFIRKRLISWQSKKQIIVANSTTKAEYVAASSCCGQIDDWNGLKMLRMNLGLKPVTRKVNATGHYLLLLGKKLVLRGTSLDPPWSELELHLSGDEFLRNMTLFHVALTSLIHDLYWFLTTQVEFCHQAEVKFKFICHWANPFKDSERSNVPRIKLSSFSEWDDTFTR
ncbi:putative reverse transcriptase, RNA-dependent DNA polymerase [Tanacetum coccineum]